MRKLALLLALVGLIALPPLAFAQQGVLITPSSGGGLAVAPSSSTAAEGARVLKATAGNVYSISVTSGASAGYVMVFNSATAPADGAVTPVKCWSLAATSSMHMTFNPVPMHLGTGVTVVFSTTGCFTKTASATAHISGEVR